MTEAYAGFAILELMGHRRLAGRVKEVQQYGVTMLRLDVPGPGGAIVATQFYGGSALYCVTPCDEATAIAVARMSGDAAPVKAWELPRLAPARVDDGEVEGSDDEERDSEEIPW